MKKLRTNHYAKTDIGKEMSVDDVRLAQSGRDARKWSSPRSKVQTGQTVIFHRLPLRGTGFRRPDDVARGHTTRVR